MALFCKLSVVLLFSLINLSMENVLKKDTETLPDVIAEGDPESNRNIFKNQFFYFTMMAKCTDNQCFELFSDCFTDNDCDAQRVCIDYHCAKGIRFIIRKYWIQLSTTFIIKGCQCLFLMLQLVFGETLYADQIINASLKSPDVME